MEAQGDQFLVILVNDNLALHQIDRGSDRGELPVRIMEKTVIQNEVTRLPARNDVCPLLEISFH